jgi:predicted N-acyltransferase
MHRRIVKLAVSSEVEVVGEKIPIAELYVYGRLGSWRKVEDAPDPHFGMAYKSLISLALPRGIEGRSQKHL